MGYVFQFVMCMCLHQQWACMYASMLWCVCVYNGFIYVSVLGAYICHCACDSVHTCFSAGYVCRCVIFWCPCVSVLCVCRCWDYVCVGTELTCTPVRARASLLPHPHPSTLRQEVRRALSTLHLSLVPLGPGLPDLAPASPSRCPHPSLSLTGT